MLEDYEGTSLDALRQMVALGMGLSVFPANYAASEIGADRSVALKPLAGEPLVRTLGFVWRPAAVSAPHFEALADLAREVLRTGPAPGGVDRKSD